MKKTGFVLLAMAALLPWVSPPMALTAGMAFALCFGNPFASITKKYTPKLMAYAIVCLGASMNITQVLKAGASGFVYTCIGIVGTLCIGHVLSKRLGCHPHTGLLVSSGTAICGGSAIAAVSSALQAKDSAVSIALATVFFLNACALFVFPWAGHALHLTPTQFGLWSALAIHDTSSVVGACLAFHPDALNIGTTLKLARALWIIPLALGVGYMHRTQGVRIKKPWFILGFLSMALVFTYIPFLKPAAHLVTLCGKRMLVLTLLGVGSGLTHQTLRDVGFKPLVLGVLLWLCVASTTLWAIVQGWITLA